MSLFSKLLPCQSNFKWSFLKVGFGFSFDDLFLLSIYLVGKASSVTWCQMKMLLYFLIVWKFIRYLIKYYWIFIKRNKAKFFEGWWECPGLLFWILLFIHSFILKSIRRKSPHDIIHIILPFLVPHVFKVMSFRKPTNHIL